MKRWDEMNKMEQDDCDDVEKKIAWLLTRKRETQEDLINLYRCKEWTDSHHNAEQALMRTKDNLQETIDVLTKQAIKDHNGCIHLELASLAREKDKNSIGAQTAISNIEHFANKITNLTI